jgi:hypothetical protein
MSPSQHQTGPQGSASSKGKTQQQLSITTFMFKYASEKSSNTPATGIHQRKTHKIINPVNCNQSKQTQIIHYLTPIQPIRQLEPLRPHKSTSFQYVRSDVHNNLFHEFNQAMPTHSSGEPSGNPNVYTPPKWTQLQLTKFFRLNPPRLRNHPSNVQPVQAMTANPKSLRHALITYKKPKKPLPKIT